MATPLRRTHRPRPTVRVAQVPAFYRGAATSAETFTCPTCRNEFSLGPAVTLTLVGDSNQVVRCVRRLRHARLHTPGAGVRRPTSAACAAPCARYRNKAEFLAALRTNKTFGFGKDGLQGALKLFKARLERRQQVGEARMLVCALGLP